MKKFTDWLFNTWDGGYLMGAVVMAIAFLLIVVLLVALGKL